MTRRFWHGTAILFASGLLLHGQRDPQPAASAARTWVIDAVAQDAAGRPVNDLGPADFELTLGGKVRKIVSFTSFDTVLHSARNSAGLEPAVPLTPDENRRIVVAVVDDVGMSPEGVESVREMLRALAGSVTASGGRMAILRAGGGTGALRQLTGDSRILSSAIDEMHYLSRASGPASAGRATWLALASALDGLADFPGRKVVTVLTENPCGPAPAGAASSDIRHAAHVAGAAVYTLRPGGAVMGEVAASCPLASLARDTGGHFGGAPGDVMAQEQRYYAIGIAQDEDVIDPLGRWSAAVPAEIKVLREGVVLRSRLGYMRYVPAADSLLPEPYTAVYNRALRSPFASSGLRTRLSTAMIGVRATPVVQASVFLDAHDLTFTRDLEGVFHGGVMLGLVAYREYIRTPDLKQRELSLTLKPDEMRQALNKGILTTVEISLPAPGAWQVQGIVADRGSDRIGSAAQFIEVPDLTQNRFGIGGLSLIGDGHTDPTVRSFRQNETLVFEYTSINESTVDRKASLEMRTNVLSGTRTVREGAIFKISFEEALRGAHRQIAGKLTLNDLLAPGYYLLEVTVRDVLAPAGRPNTATQVIDFQVRQ